MTLQANLYEQHPSVLCHKRDPQTSRDAAERVIHNRTRETWRKKILNALRVWDRPEGFTCEELAIRMGGQHLAGEYYFKISKRMNELGDSVVVVGEREGKRAWRAK